MDFESGQHAQGYLGAFVIVPLLVAAWLEPKLWPLWVAAGVIGLAYGMAFYHLGYMAGSKQRLQINLNRNQTLVTPIVQPSDDLPGLWRRF